MRVLSGIQPSGALHLGNYFGMVAPLVARQAQDELFVCVVDLHALTSDPDPAALAQRTFGVAVDLLALGLDPARATLFVQSAVPEVALLAWVLAARTPVGLLERAVAYKDKVARGLPASAGLFTYPVLQAADILLYRAELVPAGADQAQHLEIARELARRFNRRFGETFPLPRAEIAREAGVVPGTDGRKMSKSAGNTVEPLADEPRLREQVARIVTDSTPAAAPKDPDRSPLFALCRLVLAPGEVAELEARWRAPGLRYDAVKARLAAALLERFAPARGRREALLRDPAAVRRVLDEGAA
ncbi:MAG TPA: tryptophan--tRNA ligase, partial [Thermodesulfobacteriota bacterium]|nr:tryptophan--tRNA ligase [Thermodesulfobacteriota bacterium]